MKISLIIPVYNTANYLKDCLDSCLHQKPFILNKDYEIICVNDGSTDTSRQILAEYESQGVIIIDQENAGVSVARNNGLLHAKGDFIWFIDSDDYIECNILGPIYHTLSKDHSEGLRIEIQLTPEDSTYNINNIKRELKICAPYKKASTAVNYVISRMYLLNHKILFDNTIAYGEDTLWVFWINFFHGHFTYCVDPIYFYRQRVGSAMHSKSEDRHLKHLNSMMAMLQAYQKALTHYGESLSAVEQNHLQYRIYWSVQNILFDAIRVDESIRKDILKRLISDKLYPYPILWNRLSLKYGFKNIIINLLCLFFPYKWYYNIVSYIYHITH